eukprot:scaffold1436_cov250-Pinguiococcus_pyrenoidosus.AAC.9
MSIASSSGRTSILARSEWDHSPKRAGVSGTVAGLDVGRSGVIAHLRVWMVHRVAKVLIYRCRVAALGSKCHDGGANVVWPEEFRVRCKPKRRSSVRQSVHDDYRVRFPVHSWIFSEKMGERMEEARQTVWDGRGVPSDAASSSSRQN